MVHAKLPKPTFARRGHGSREVTDHDVLNRCSAACRNFFMGHATAIPRFPGDKKVRRQHAEFFAELRDQPCFKRRNLKIEEKLNFKTEVFPDDDRYFERCREMGCWDGERWYSNSPYFTAASLCLPELYNTYKEKLGARSSKRYEWAAMLLPVYEFTVSSTRRVDGVDSSTASKASTRR